MLSGLPAYRSLLILSAFALVASAGLVCARGASAQSPGETFTQAVPGTDVTFDLAFVPEGRFTLGSPDDEVGRDEDEGPRRRVSVEAFWMGTTEVTYDAYSIFRDPAQDSDAGANGEAFGVEMVTRPSPAYEDPAHGMGTFGHPMVGMTRQAAMNYARWLSEKTGRLFRLPTEAEWEYACHAGVQDVYTFGDDVAPLDEHAWHEANSGDEYHEVGLKEPNPWGIHDLHGNVAEWTMDRYDRRFYEIIPQDGSAVNPRTEEGTRGLGVVRGGSFEDDAAGLRCAQRIPEDTRWKRRDPQMPKSRWWNTDSQHVGFRLVSPAQDYTPDEIREYWERILGPR